MLIASWRTTTTAYVAVLRAMQAHHSQLSEGCQFPDEQEKSPTSMMKGMVEGIDDAGRIEALCNRGELDLALDIVLSRIGMGMGMGVDMGISQPSDRVYLCLLKACHRSKALTQVRRLHAHLALHSQSSLTGFLGNYLVITLAKCGALHDADQLLQSLPHRTVHSWTALISGYAELNRGQDALIAYSLMQEDGLKPDHYTYVALLKACGTIPDLEKGIHFHALARKHGFTSIPFVGNTLVRMYGRCGSILEAENVFQELAEHNVVSWNAMLSAYVEHGHEDKAMQLYRQLLEERVSPDLITFVNVLQACGSLAKKDEATRMVFIEIGQALHANAQRKGFTSNVFISSTLESMYGKCGIIAEAENVFDRLSHHTVVTWNAMLSAYVEQGEGRKALQLYMHMQEEGESPNQQTIVIALQACGILADKEEAFEVEAQSTKVVSLKVVQALHVDAARTKGFVSNPFVHNTLVSMYGRCGSLAQAETLFSGSSKCEVVSWNAMISVYVEEGQGDKALKLYRQLQEECKHPNLLTFVIALRACGSLAEKEGAVFAKVESNKVVSLEIGRALHADAQRKGFDSHIFVGNTLVSMYGKCGSIAEAKHVFGGLPERNIVSWNAMLSAYVDHSEGNKALQLYTQMQKEGESPNKLTFVLVLQACGILAEEEEAFVPEAPLEIGQSLHALLKQKGFTSDVCVGCTLMSMYGKCGLVEEVKIIFNEMPLYNVVPWNAMLSAYIEQDQGDKVLELYRNMQKVNITVTDITLVCVLQACGGTGCLEICGQLHFSIVSTGCDLSPVMANTLIYAYRSCASIVDALAVFDGLPQHAVVSWNACIAGHAHEGNCVESMYMFEKMHLAGKKPDEITFLSLLTAYSHAGLVDKGVEYFKSLSRDYGVTPDLKHYAIVIDLFGRAGDLKGVESIIRRMSMHANLSIWLCILSACRTHGNVELGKHAFDHAIQLHPMDAAAYVLMSNIYSDAGLQECANEVENLSYIENSGKKPYQSWVEDEEVDTLSVGDNKHWQGSTHEFLVM